MVEEGESGKSSPAADSQTAPNYSPYPPALSTYEQVFRSREVFMDTLKNLHAAMGTKFMIPIVGGRDLDLHRLFLEVTSRGGIAKVVKDKKWRDLTLVFNFPSSATNASFILRKYYVSLLYHYEQIYYFKAKCWSPTTDAFQYVSSSSALPRGGSGELNAAALQERASVAASASEESPCAGSPVCGVIDGKFDGGYLVTVAIGSEELKGVLYQVPSSEARASPVVEAGIKRRKRRKKCEIRKRDPAHPKPNRSGYNFFFAEQHARLKPLHPGKDREISRMIGELWNKLQESERTVYQEQAHKDKERYKLEMERYRERLRAAETTPTQQHPPIPETNSMDFDVNLELEATGTTSDESYESGYDNMADLKNVDMGIFGEAFELQTGQNKNELQENVTEEMKASSSAGEDGITTVLVEEKEPMPGDGSELQESH